MAGLFSPESIERVRAASDLVEVIGSSIPLKRAGANFVALCPFHKEKTPSFSVNPQKQIFYCFGCHKGGDVFRFVQDYEGIGFAEAIRRLDERARIPLEFVDGERGRQQHFAKERLLAIHEAITQRWQMALKSDPGAEAARSYLQQRGVTSEAIEIFRLGYAPDLWDDSVNWAKGKGFDHSQVEQAGIIIRKDGTDHYYDRFRGRLIFPICDDQGRVIGFSGRTLSGEKQIAKYVNSPETPIFNKSKVFYGLDKAKRALLDSGFAVLCEGQLDLISCHSAGIKNVVAPQGTAFTADHARILKRYVDEVVLCFDADAAGQEAVVRIKESLLESGLAIRVVSLPPPHDPDSFIREQGGPVFAELVRQGKEFFDFLLDHLCARFDLSTDKGQSAVVHGMAEAVIKHGDAVLLDKYAQKTAMRLAARMELPLSPDAVRAEFRKAATHRKTPRPASEPESADVPAPAARPNPHEFWLLKLLLLDESLLDWARAHLQLDWIRHTHAREIISARLAAHARGQHEVAALLSEFADPQIQSLVTEAATETRAIPNREQQLKDVVRRLRDQDLDRQLSILTQRSSEAALSDADRDDLLRQQQELRRAKRRPLT